jgi:hypothetical protein
MINLSNELLKAFSKYLNGELSIAQFRDYIVGLRLDKYSRLADADKLFLNEFEGRYAEFSDFGKNEALLKSSLALYVQADDVASNAHASVIALRPANESTGSFSINLNSGIPTGTFAQPLVLACADHN